MELDGYMLYRILTFMRENHRAGHSAISCTATTGEDNDWCKGSHPGWLGFIHLYNREVAKRVPE